MGCVYTLGHQPGSEVRNNVCHGRCEYMLLLLLVCHGRCEYMLLLLLVLGPHPDAVTHNSTNYLLNKYFTPCSPNYFLNEQMCRATTTGGGHITRMKVGVY
jgi:hypothetical protein